MQLAARKVLEDVISTHEMLEHETDPQRFRILWIAAISLCRSVGQVLDKIDGKTSSSWSNRIRSQWKEIQSNVDRNLIFHEFIEKERNLILKEYEIGYISEKFSITDGDRHLGILDEGLYSPLSSGHYAGEDCRDVMEEAISGGIKNLPRLRVMPINNGAQKRKSHASFTLRFSSGVMRQVK